MKCEVFSQPYRGFPVRVFWMRPADRGPLIYGYWTADGDFEVESTGFSNTVQACRHAAKVIDDLVAGTGVPKARAVQTEFNLIQAQAKVRRRRQSSRAEGRNPRALGTNPRALKKRNAAANIIS
jgi:hypothetical protein